MNRYDYDDWPLMQLMQVRVHSGYTDYKSGMPTKYYDTYINHRSKMPMKYYGILQGISNAVTTPTIGMQATGSSVSVDFFNIIAQTADSTIPNSAPLYTIKDFKTKKGYRIIVNDEGEYEIEAPPELVLEDFLRAHPSGKILDAKGNVLETTDGIITGTESLINASGRFIDIKSPLVRVRDTLLASTFGRIAIPADGCRLVLPDEVELIVHKDGSYEVNESRKSFTYKAAPRDFNKYLNASDVVEDFIRFLGSCDVRQRHVMGMPLGLFLNWLVIQAAKADGEAYADIESPLIESVNAVKAQPRCNFCKRFLSQARADAGVNFCSPQHMHRFTLREDIDRPKPRRKPLLQLAAPPSDTYFQMEAA